MKNFKFLSLLFLTVVVGFSSCKKDDESKAEVMASIVGKWGITKTVDVPYVGTAKGPAETVITFTAEDYIDFKSDGTATYSEVGDTDPATYTINAETKKLTVKFTGTTQTVVYDIKTLNATDLVLYDEEILVQGGITYKFTTETSFKKK